MSRSTGTGSPLWFMCRVERKRAFESSLRGARPEWRHKVKLTGRTSALVREYHCLTCGHTGWSNHIDLERMEKHPNGSA